MTLRTLIGAATVLAGLTATTTLYAQKPVLTEGFESGKIDPAVWDTRQKGGETIAVEPVEGAHVYLTGIRDGNGNELMYFEIALTPSNAAPQGAK